MSDFIDNHMANLNSVGAIKLALYGWRKTHAWGKTQEAIGETELANKTGVQRKAVRAFRKTLPRATREELPGKVDRAPGDGPIYIVSQPADDGLKVLPRTFYAWPLSAEILRLSKREGGGGKKDPTQGANLPLRGGGKLTPGGGGQKGPTQSSTDLLQGPNTSSSDSGQTMIFSEKENKIVQVVTSRFRSQQLSLPPGRMPVEEIAGALSKGNQGAEALEELGRALDAYIEHMKDAPRTWRHVVNSIKNFCSGDERARKFNPKEIQYETFEPNSYMEQARRDYDET